MRLCRHFDRNFSPAWPNGVCPRSCPSAMASMSWQFNPSSRADVARDAPDQLHVQPAAADVVVLHQAEHLRFACVAVISGDVHDLVDIARERRARLAWPHRGGCPRGGARRSSGKLRGCMRPQRRFSATACSTSGSSCRYAGSLTALPFRMSSCYGLIVSHVPLIREHRFYAVYFT